MTATLYLSVRQVSERFGVNRASIWRWLKTDPTFPKPLSLTPGTSRWRLSELEEWERTKAAA